MKLLHNVQENWLFSWNLCLKLMVHIRDTYAAYTAVYDT